MSKFRLREDRDNVLLYREVKDLPSEGHQVFRDGFFGYMAALKKRASKEILRKPKGGETYIIYRAGRRRRHTSSAPGETHANLTGKLRRSLSWKVHGWERAEFGYGISSNAQSKAPEYAGSVELGTRFMAARPSLMNAVKDVDADPHFDRAVGKMVRGFGK